MTPNDDPVVRLLSRLPAVMPDATRAARTRERCARALDAKGLPRRSAIARRWVRSAEHRRLALHRAESVVVGALSLIYAAAMFANWLRWR